VVRTALLLALVLPLLAAATPPPALRLPDSVIPLRCALDLTLLPEQETFEGSVEIDTRIKRASTTIWLHASGLTIKDAAFQPSGGPSVRATPRTSGASFLGLDFRKALPAGRGRIRIRFSGPVSRKDNLGLFSQTEDGHRYLFSQFEWTSARQAFPCFDEPCFKVPWQLTLHVPKKDLAFSNTPITSQKAERNGLKRVRFATTRPLPSYLVAVGVGPFEVIDAGRAGRKGTPIRLIVPRGHTAEAAYAAKAIPQLFTRLEDYFGIPYPYEKLDNLVAPNPTFGGMENAGLILYGQTYVMAKASEETITFKRWSSTLLAHEMAHQWFGDLVTMPWWNDIWLNESFATWMENKIISEWKPEWEGDIDRVLNRDWAMKADSLLTSRMIRQPILAQADIDNAFDGITYSKGGAVLAMFEAHIGPAPFRTAIRRHLEEHAHGNATTTDFLAALAAQGGPRIPEAFASFLDQAGLPLLTAELEPAGAGSLLRLTQRRFLPTGSRAPGPRTWHIPVTLRYSVGGKATVLKIVADSRSMTVPLPVKAEDLDYLLLNDGMSGYYRTVYRGDLLARLLKKGTLPEATERIGLLADVDGAAMAGELPKAEVLRMTQTFAADPNAQVVTAMARLVRGMGPDLVPDAVRPNYARFIQRHFGERAQTLGFRPAPGEGEATGLLRQSLVPLVAVEGADAGLLAQARTLAIQWLDDPGSLDPNVTDMVLDLAARSGDRPLFDRFLAAAKASRDQAATQRLLTALGSFDDPALERAALSELLNGHFDPALAFWYLLQPGTQKAASRTVVLEFVKQHFDELATRLPREVMSFLPAFVGSTFSSAKDRDGLEGFFKDRIAPFPGGSHTLAQTLERITQAEVRKASQSDGVGAFLAAY